jgi:predicted membrane protein
VELIVRLLQYHVIQQVTLAAYQINALVHYLTHGQNQLKLVIVNLLILWTMVLVVCYVIVIFKLLIINGSSVVEHQLFRHLEIRKHTRSQNRFNLSYKDHFTRKILPM